MSNKRMTNQILDIRVHKKGFLNIIDEDVQSMFSPFTLLQNSLLSPKYRIKNNVITLNNLFNKCLLLCGTVICMSLYFYGLLIHHEVKYLYDTKHSIFSLCYEFCFHFSGFFVNFIINLVQTRTAVAFVLNIQEIHRFIDDENMSKKYIRNSWISVAIIICYYFISCVSYYIVNPTVPIVYTIGFAALIHFDSNIIYAIRFIKMLQNKMRQWDYMVYFSFNDNEIKTCRRRLFQTYFQILQSYQLYKNMFHQMVLYYVVQNFIHFLLNVELFIDLYQIPCGTEKQHLALSSTAMLFIWMLKNLTLQTVLCLNCEQFYIAVEDSQDTCTHILISNCTDDDKKLCKNVRRAYRASFSKMRACRLFYVDVCLLLHLAALLTNYTIVLLQFAFL